MTSKSGILDLRNSQNTSNFYALVGVKLANSKQ